MPQQPLPVASYTLPSRQASSARLVNCYAEQAPKDAGKQAAILRRAPGIRDWCTISTEVSAAIRGGGVMAGVPYVVSGTTVYSIAADGIETALTGTPVAGSGRVICETNGTDLVIVVPGTTLAYSTQGSTVAQITDPDFLAWGAIDVAFLDGYLAFVAPDSQLIFNSGLNALTFNGLDVASVEGAPDMLAGIIANNRELFLPGTSSAEIWYNAANPAGSPFQRSPAGFLMYGIAAPLAKANQDNSVFWLANDRTIRRLSTASPVKVSQYGVDSVIARLPVVEDAFCNTYTIDGHMQVAFTFPNASRCFVFDCSTNEWHERESLGYGHWRPAVVLEAYGMTICGDSFSGRVGIMDPDTHEEWGEPQRVAWRYQSISGQGKRISHLNFELAVNTGSGLPTGQGSNPLATLKLSNDGGMTFQSMPTMSLGATGKYETRVLWWQLGLAYERVYEIEITDPVPLFAFDTYIDATPAG